MIRGRHLWQEVRNNCVRGVCIWRAIRWKFPFEPRWTSAVYLLSNECGVCTPRSLVIPASLQLTERYENRSAWVVKAAKAAPSFFVLKVALPPQSLQVKLNVIALSVVCDMSNPPPHTHTHTNIKSNRQLEVVYTWQEQGVLCRKGLWLRKDTNSKPYSRHIFH